MTGLYIYKYNNLKDIAFKRLYVTLQQISDLGHELHKSGSMEYDANVKRTMLISQSVEIRETFYFASHVDIISARKVYCSSYGCHYYDSSSNLPLTLNPISGLSY